MTKPVSRAELRRLGKLGSYRLGALAPQGIARPASPRQFRPAFGRTYHSGPTTAWVLLALAGAALTGGGALLALWYLPVIVGVLTGIAARWGAWRTRVSILAVILMCAGGWGAALGWYSVRGQPVGATARAIAAIAGLPPYAAVTIAAALGVSVLLGLTGLWLGRALTPRPSR
jgi:hypothetical protein